MTASILSLYHFEPVVRVLGPGKRCGIWVQGCPFACPGCCAPDSQSSTGGQPVRIADLLNEVLLVKDTVEGVTVSGGEPFAQADQLSEFLQLLSREVPHMTVMIFTGFSLCQLRKRRHEAVDSILRNTDILIDGLFMRDQQTDAVWTASTNQTVNYLSDRYCDRDMERSRRELELFSSSNSGKMFVAGIPKRRKGVPPIDLTQIVQQ